MIRPNTISRVSALNIATRVIDRGRGDTPVILLHGNPDSATEWHLVTDLLGPRYRCIAIDLPGFGESAPLPETYDHSVEAQVEFLDALLAELGLKDSELIVVGHDIGAIMGLGWAAVHPEKVMGIVVSNTIYAQDYHWHAMAKMWAAPFLGKLSMLLMNRWIFRLGMKKDFPNVSEREVDRMYAGITPVTRQTILRLYQKMTRPEYFAAWERRFQDIGKSVPTVVVWGAGDHLIPTRFAYRTSDRVRLLDGVSHWAPLEAPEAIAAEIRRMAESIGQP